MPTFYESIPADLGEWALSQPLFFVASAPLHTPTSHVNVSPKGLPASTLTILSPTQCAYLDATGSGCETIAHVYENGRVTLMFASFGRGPRICRFFCRGRVVEWDEPAFAGWVARMGKGAVPGTRAVVVLDVWQVQTSCGWGVPLLSAQPSTTSEASATPSTLQSSSLLTDRPTMSSFATKLAAKDALRAYQARFNGKSLDGLPGLKVCRRDVGERLWVTDARARVRRVAAQWEGILVGVLMGWLVVGVVLGMGMRVRVWGLN
ncbi:hypothetical protein MMC32_000298 [Xylographa parallela]|nr:hypothetical protein [Xylographa parallela]